MFSSQLIQLIQLLQHLGAQSALAIKWALANLTFVQNLINNGTNLHQIVQIILKTIGVA